MQKSLGKFADVSGLTAVGKGFERVAQTSFVAFQNLARMVGPLQAIIGAASVGGIVKLATDFASFANSLNNTATRAGVTSQQLQLLQGSAKLAGVSTEVTASGITALNDNLQKAVHGQAPQFVLLMDALGISWHNADGSARSVAEVLPQLEEAIKNTKNPVAQATIATQAFNAAGEQMLPWLRLGSVQIGELTRVAQKYGILTGQQLADGIALARAENELEVAVAGLANTIGSDLAPVLTPLIDDLSQWIGANRELIGQDIAATVKTIGDAIKAVDWKAVWTGIKEIAVEINSVVQSLGGWKVAAEGVAAVMVLPWLGGTLLKLTKLARLMYAVGLIAPAAAAIAGVVLQSGSTADTPENRKAQDAQSADEATAFRMAHPEMFAGHENDPNYSPYTDPNSPFHAQTIGQAWANRPSWLGGSGGGSKATPGPSTEQQKKLGLDAMAYFQSKEGGGWSKEQAAGIVAGFVAESGLNASSIGDGGLAYGAGQWHPDRQANFRAWSGHDIRQSTLQEQLAFKAWELSHTEKAAGDRLRGAKTANEAGQIDSRYDVRPGDVEGEATRRGAGAEAWLNAAAGAQGQPANIAGGAASPTPDPSLTVRGSANVNVRLANAPPGTTASASTEGDLFALPDLKIAGAMNGAPF